MTAKRWEYKRFRFSTIRLLGGALQTERQRIGATTSAHENVRIGDIYYNLNESAHTAEVTNNPYKYSGDIIIPSSVNYREITHDVTSIGDDTFNGCSGLTSVKIPNSVTCIEDYAFSMVVSKRV